MIYLLEDETSIRKLVVYTLNNSGFVATGFANAQEFWLGMREEIPQLVLLDIMLPDGDGLHILEKLRATPATAKLPIMMLTAKDTEFDKVLGLDLGADDYLPKPFGMMELIARINSLLRRAEAKDEKPEEYNIAGLFVSIPAHMVTVDNEPLVLALKEFDVLTTLLRNRGIVLTRDQIMANVWGYDFDGENRTVDVHIRTLRVKLGKYANLVETVRGIGYRMRGSV